MTRILFNCDDFGRTQAINAAVRKAHEEGVLGSASLMVTGRAFSEAVEIARSHPALKVGLHLALSDAAPVLPPDRIPALIENGGRFPRDPAVTGLRLAFQRRAREDAASEIRAQFERFAATGLPASHVDGHHHLHMHPFVFSECARWAEKFGFARIRVAREFGVPLPPRRDYREFPVKCARHFTFLGLSFLCERLLAKSALTRLDGVLGLWETGRMSEAYLLDSIPKFLDGDWEVYLHAGAEDAEEELAALLSPSLKRLLHDLKIECL
ncbi:MAG: ChbG/HpnK family deacetylase [Verrucomicrobia bacterium]|nr:ChbG/HpnK family deacetylase [Verrucomicrobiota bacterium]